MAWSPFVITHDQAVAAMREWLGQGFWRPGDLAARAAVVKMTPVYVPYWVFDADTHTYWTADSSRVPMGTAGNWHPQAGAHEGTYKGLLVGASAALTGAGDRRALPIRFGEGGAAGEGRFTKHHVRAVRRAAEICPSAGAPGIGIVGGGCLPPICGRQLPQHEGKCADDGFDEPADALAGVDYGVSLRRSIVSLHRQRAEREAGRASTAFVSQNWSGRGDCGDSDRDFVAVFRGTNSQTSGAIIPLLHYSGHLVYCEQ